jgi:hypothetical protein
MGHPPMTAHRRLLRFAPLLVATFALRAAVPQSAVVAHVHAGGGHAHVHLGGERTGLAATHPHPAGAAHHPAAQGHEHQHDEAARGHAHPHDHGTAPHHGHEHHHDDEDGAGHALVVPGDAAHVHWQAPFQRAVPAALPPAIVLATAGPVPATATPPGLERPRPSSRSRGPPRV